MKDYDRLKELLSHYTPSEKKWVQGKVPSHYKRISLSAERSMYYAKLGAAQLMAYYDMMPYYTQSIIAGAVLSGDFDKINIVTTSQYGKSYTMARLALLLAYKGNPVYICAASGNIADIIMNHVINGAVQSVDESVQRELTKENKTEVEKLATSLSKQRVGFKNGGSVSALTLGGMYEDISSNKAVGRAGVFIVDEAAEIADKKLAELGRAEIAQIDGKKYPIIMISNPHKPGRFYDNMIDENIDDRTLVIWMDALTAVEEERVTVEQVLSSGFSKERSTLRRYWLCELDTDGESMFDTPKVLTDAEASVIKSEPYRQYFLGIDAAYKGKDGLDVCLGSIGEDGKICVHEILNMKKGDWIDGVTSKDIIRDISKIAAHYRVSMICVDIGYGVWLVEGLLSLGYNVRGINFGGGPTRERVRVRHYSATNAMNMRAELHLDLQSLIDDDKIRFEVEALNKIKPILPFVNSERRASGKIKIVDKSHIKVLIGKSPDELDSVLLMIHAAILMCGESVVYYT